MIAIYSMERITLEKWRTLLHKREDADTHYVMYWLCQMLSNEIDNVLASISWSMKTINDPRYTSQLVIFHDELVDEQAACRKFIKDNHESMQINDRRKCRMTWYHYNRHSCRPYKLGSLLLCYEQYRSIECTHYFGLRREFFGCMIRDLYYVRKLRCQRRLSVPLCIEVFEFGNDPLGNLASWEVVCADDEKELLSHPLLPHPSDFLVRDLCMKKGKTYADKARFEYSFTSGLDGYKVVFPMDKPCVIPRLLPVRDVEHVVPAPSLHMPEEAFVKESCSKCACKKTKRKKKPSLITKESRKKIKTIKKMRRQQTWKGNLHADLACDPDDDDDYYYDYPSDDDQSYAYWRDDWY